VPSWDGGDLPELVRDSTEFRDWVEQGASRRFWRDPIARFFLRRAALKMPAYKNRLGPQGAPALWAYVNWLRSSRPH